MNSKGKCREIRCWEELKEGRLINCALFPGAFMLRCLVGGREGGQTTLTQAGLFSSHPRYRVSIILSLNSLVDLALHSKSWFRFSFLNNAPIHEPVSDLLQNQSFKILFYFSFMCMKEKDRLPMLFGSEGGFLLCTFSASYSFKYSCFSSSVRSRHIPPMIFPISHNFKSGLDAFTWSQTLIKTSVVKLQRTKYLQNKTSFVNITTRTLVLSENCHPKARLH